MSSDNYYMVAKEPNGKYVVSMGFDSDERWPIPSSRDPRFDTEGQAIAEAMREYSEYGVRMHPSCHGGSETFNALKEVVSGAYGGEHQTRDQFVDAIVDELVDSGMVRVREQRPLQTKGEFIHENGAGATGMISRKFKWERLEDGSVVFVITHGLGGSGIKITPEEVATLLIELDPNI